MKSFSALLASCLLAAGPVWAESRNLLNVDLFGDHNGLTILQEHSAGLAPNVIALTLSGDGNGGAGREWARPLFGGLDLRPGHIAQRGGGNRIEVHVRGQDNLFAFRQTGGLNHILGGTIGAGNAVAVDQSGTGNSFGFHQAGNGNVIIATQRSH